MKSRVHPTYKTKYHVQNWAAYDRALVCRGDITIWLSPATIAAWEPDGAGTRGAQRKYSDLAIESALTLRLLFHLPLRQTEGFLTSLFVLMGLDLRSPDHTTLVPSWPTPRPKASGRSTGDIVNSCGSALGVIRRPPSDSRCLRHSLLIRQPICVRAATRTMTARLG